MACFMRFSMSTQDARLEVFKKQYQKITYLSLLKDRQMTAIWNWKEINKSFRLRFSIIDKKTEA